MRERGREGERARPRMQETTPICSHMTCVEKEIPILQKDEAEVWNAKDKAHAQKPESSHKKSESGKIK